MRHSKSFHLARPIKGQSRNQGWTVGEKNCQDMDGSSPQATGGLTLTGVTLPDGSGGDRGCCVVLCGFQRAFDLNFWLIQFSLCVFWIILSSSFYGWRIRLEVTCPKAHNGSNKQAGLGLTPSLGGGWSGIREGSVMERSGMGMGIGCLKR